MASNGSRPRRRPPQISISPQSGRDLIHNLYSDDTLSTSGTPDFTRNLLPPSSLSPGQSPTQSHHHQIYGVVEAGESADMLVPPLVDRGRRPYQSSVSESPSPSAMSSRRTSWASDTRSIDSRQGLIPNMFVNSRSSSRTGSEDGDINTQTVVEKYNIMPTDDLIIFPEDVEKDDHMHNPDVHDKDLEGCHVCSKRGFANIGGLILITLGVLTLFIGYPVLTFVRKITDPIPPPPPPTPKASCLKNSLCLDDNMPLLKNVRTGLIDQDTPQSAMTKTSHDGKTLQLVFSDEFNVDGRTFFDGDDPYFEAVDMWYGATEDLEWYDPDAVTTANGTLNIKFDAFENHNLEFRSGMVQSWNKLCFKGGRIEASISLPGRGDVSGFWPGFWAMGNLGRPGYVSTTDGLWPYSYWDKCDAGITPNQSSPDGLSKLPGMRLPACTCQDEDHPSPGKSRSAPEIDAIEASVGYLGPGQTIATGTASQSFQAAPFDIWYQPDYNFVELYDSSISSMNGYRGGPYQEALSAVTWLNNDWYEGHGYQLYGFEYTPGATGDITWFIGDQYTWKIDGRSIRPNGNIGQRVVPEEPMSIIMNFGMSDSFATIMRSQLLATMPATMRFDYVRIYQEEGNEVVTCDPEGYPTTEYIKKHLAPYSNPNLTHWRQTEYEWPKNTLMNGCS